MIMKHGTLLRDVLAHGYGKLAQNDSTRYDSATTHISAQQYETKES
jgi:hypothetical protein